VKKILQDRERLGLAGDHASLMGLLNKLIGIDGHEENQEQIQYPPKLNIHQPSRGRARNKFPTKYSYREHKCVVNHQIIFLNLNLFWGSLSNDYLLKVCPFKINHHSYPSGWYKPFHDCIDCNQLILLDLFDYQRLLSLSKNGALQKNP
jgi:hypothetical protein